MRGSRFRSFIGRHTKYVYLVGYFNFFVPISQQIGKSIIRGKMRQKKKTSFVASCDLWRRFSVALWYVKIVMVYVPISPNAMKKRHLCRYNQFQRNISGHSSRPRRL